MDLALLKQTENIMQETIEENTSLFEAFIRPELAGTSSTMTFKPNKATNRYLIAFHEKKCREFVRCPGKYEFHFNKLKKLRLQGNGTSVRT